MPFAEMESDSEFEGACAAASGSEDELNVRLCD